MTINTKWICALFCSALLVCAPGGAQDDAESPWPREIDVPRGKVVLYQPQPEKLTGNQLDARTAVAVEIDGAEPVFGAIWVHATLITDRDERSATVSKLAVTKVRFPEQDAEREKKLRQLLETEVPKWNLPIQLDRLLTTLESVDDRVRAAKRIKVDPPIILFSTEPSVLITIDGEPRMLKEEGTNLERVVNTPFTIFLDPASKTYYLNADVETWYAATELKGQWAVAKTVPAEVAARAPEPDPEEEEEAAAEAEEEGEKEEPGPPPGIIVATEPTELIVCDGKPKMTSVTDTQLLTFSNTDSDVVFDIMGQKYYVLLSGRWYASAKMEGPWTHVPGENLPDDFAKIPETDDMATVLYAVPGTEVAKEAVLDAQIPQTATVERQKATLTVEYDGEPKFEKIESTSLTYVVNTATPVIRVANEYYACDEAIWFVASSPKGPWQVATSVPAEIYSIPPESPLYNVTFVYVYDSTPEVVHVGYTPGYTGTYVYHTTIVYGTGYWYRPWWGRVYYPRAVTWGFHVRWNPWRGWGIGFSWGVGPFRFAVRRGGWWGPRRHRGYRRSYRRGYRRGARAGFRAGYRAGRRSSSHNNVYRSQRNRNRTRPQTQPANRAARGQAGGANRRSNNVYADRNGNVHRKTNNGWESRGNNGWQSDRPGGQGGNRQAGQGQGGNRQGNQGTTQQGSSSLDRSAQSRQRGNQRASTQSGSRSGGARGGGGRR